MNVLFVEPMKALQQPESGAETAIGLNKDVARQKQKIHVTPDAHFDDFIKGVQRRVFKCKAKFVSQLLRRLHADGNIQANISSMNKSLWLKRHRSESLPTYDLVPWFPRATNDSFRSETLLTHSDERSDGQQYNIV